MLKAQIAVNLPSVETARQMGPLEWLQSLFGKTIDLRSGEEALTMSAFALIQALYRAMRTAGVTDAIALLVDKKVIYADADEVDNDLDLILRAAESAGLFLKRFDAMHLVLAHRHGGLHTLIDIKIHSHVMRGEDEMALTLSARLEHLRIVPGESAVAYAERIRAFGQRPEVLEDYRLLLDVLRERLADALRAAIPGAEIHTGPAEICLIWPDARHIGRLRHLRFGAEVDEPRYRAIPARQQYGAYNEPYYYHYHDPYNDLTNWLLLDTLLHHATWPSPALQVVQSDGTAVDVQQHPAAAAAAWSPEAVRFDEAGALQVDETIPDDWAGADVGAHSATWSSAEHTATEPGGDTRLWGGSDLDSAGTADGAWGGSEVSDTSSSSDSSCGSSCGSSDSC